MPRSNDLTSEIAQRLKALREAMGLSDAEFAERTGIDSSTLLQYESGDADIPVGFLTEVSHACGCDLTALLTGKEAHLRSYSLVKRGEGLTAERHPAYKYRRLAHRFAMPGMEPFMVTVPYRSESSDPQFSRHRGEEFIYLLEGRLEANLGNEIVVMEPGDSLYFDSVTPHSLRGLDGQSATFIDVIL